MDKQNNSPIKTIPRITKNSQSLLRKLKETVVQQNTQLLQNEIKSFDQFMHIIRNVITKIQQLKNQSKLTGQKFENEINQLKLKIHIRAAMNAQTLQDSIQVGKLKSMQQDYIYLCRNRVDVANSLDISQLKDIDIENRQSLANEPFKWIIVTIYNQPQSKYYWPNFKKVVFGSKGKNDFVERLGKVDALQATVLHRAKTQQFLNLYSKIIQKSELKKYKKQIQKIYTIADYFRKCYMIGDQMKAWESASNQHMKQRQENQEQFAKLKGRLQALEARLLLNKRYCDMINEIQQKLQPKAIAYQNASNKGKIYLKQFQNFITHPILNRIRQQKLNCDCSLF